jgi:hypothetical protein
MLQEFIETLDALLPFGYHLILLWWKSISCAMLSGQNSSISQVEGS